VSQATLTEIYLSMGRGAEHAGVPEGMGMQSWAADDGGECLPRPVNSGQEIY
jgi:hypothetical protein